MYRNPQKWFSWLLGRLQKTKPLFQRIMLRPRLRKNQNPKFLVYISLQNAKFKPKVKYREQTQRRKIRGPTFDWTYPSEWLIVASITPSLIAWEEIEKEDINRTLPDINITGSQMQQVLDTKVHQHQRGGSSYHISFYSCES